MLMNQDQPKEETYTMSSRKVLNLERPCPLPWNQDVSPSQHQQGSSTELWCPEFLLGFHYIGRIDRISGVVTELSLRPPSPSQRLSWYHLARSPNPIIMWPIFPAWPAPNLKLSKDRPWITKTFLSLTKFQQLEALSQEPGTKTRQILYYTAADIPKFTDDNFPIQNGIPNKSLPDSEGQLITLMLFLETSAWKPWMG